MPKYRTAFLMWLAVVTLFVVTASTPLPSEINVGPLAKSEEQSCWHPGLARNIGIAELSCDFWEQQLPPDRNK